jgi:hypothetical protein
VDIASAQRDPSSMSESPYAIPEDDLVDQARVPVAEQVEIQSEPRPDAAAWTGPNPFGDGTIGDADAE